MSENMFKRINTPRKHSNIVDQKILRPSEAKLQRMVIFKGARSIIYEKSEKHQSQMSKNMFKRINTPIKHSNIVDQKILRPSEAKLQRMVIFKGARSIIYNYLHSSLFWT